MPRQIVTTEDAPSSPLFSQGVKAGPHLILSGIVGIDPSTGSLAGAGIPDYARWFPSQPPARYVAKLGAEPPGLLVSIRMTAFVS